MLLIEHGPVSYPWLLVAMFLGSLPEAGVGVMLVWRALRRPSNGWH
ncbi:MAG TPA: hypothetical protein VKC66_13830 [Xanthobacteraceae bacterium]|nr:hypothetical protein [Xanthobacteraceae bacterium]